MVTPSRNKELRGERDNARNNARCTQARKATHGLDGQHQDVEESVRMTEDRNKWRRYAYVQGVANPRSRTAKEQGPDLQNFLKFS